MPCICRQKTRNSCSNKIAFNQCYIMIYLKYLYCNNLFYINFINFPSMDSEFITPNAINYFLAQPIIRIISKIALQQYKILEAIALSIIKIYLTFNYCASQFFIWTTYFLVIIGQWQCIKQRRCNEKLKYNNESSEISVHRSNCKSRQLTDIGQSSGRKLILQPKLRLNLTPNLKLGLKLYPKLKPQPRLPLLVNFLL